MVTLTLIEAWQEELEDAEAERPTISDINCYAYGHMEGRIEILKRAIEQFQKLGQSIT